MALFVKHFLSAGRAGQILGRVYEQPASSILLYRNKGDWKFTDVAAEARVAGAGYSMGAAAGNYDNDDNVDLFVAGVFRNILYCNLGDVKFKDVAERAGSR